MSDLIERCMLASDAPSDLSQLDYFQLFMQPKLDGVRARNIDGVMYSRSGEVIPNKMIQKMYGREEFHLLDGEIWWHGATFHELQSFCASEDQTSNLVRWNVFDIMLQVPYWRRRLILDKNSFAFSCNGIELVRDIQVRSATEVQQIYAGWRKSGLEGAMLRDGRMYYKHGRSTVPEQALLRIKDWETFEGVITGWGPRLENDNDQELSAVGYAKRSKSKAGMRELPEVGYFDVRANWHGRTVRFSVGATPLGRARCRELWQLGLPAVFRKTVTIKAAADRAKDLPSQPILLGIRWEGDL